MAMAGSEGSTRLEARFLEERADEAIEREHAGDGQLVRRPGRDRPQGGGEGDIDGLPAKSEEPGLRHRRVADGDALGDRVPAEKPDLLREAGIDDGLHEA